MKLPLPANTFPALELSEEDEDVLASIAEAVVKKTMAQYHEHLTKYNGIVDEHRWMKIKQRDDMRVYRDRKARSSHIITSFTSGVTGDAVDDADDEATTKTTPHILTVGRIPGNLNDVMYGALSPTTEAMALKSAFVEDGFVHSEVLASIIKPTPKSPFRELSIKWTVRGDISLVGTLTRDTVYIESIGFAQTPNGERIGYHVHHSVELPAIRELRELHIVRTSVSFCHLFRQRKHDAVEVFARGQAEFMKGIPASVAAASAAEVSVTVWRNLHCAEMKKFARMLRSKQTQTPTINAAVSGAPHDSVSADTLLPSASSQCAVCSESESGSVSSLTTSEQEDHCRICDQRVCSLCRVNKLVHEHTELQKDARETTLTLCTRCVLVVTRACASTFAECDALEGEGKAIENFELVVPLA